MYSGKFLMRNCPKHVEFLDRNKFGKISASVGFIKQKLYHYFSVQQLPLENW